MVATKEQLRSEFIESFKTVLGSQSEKQKERMSARLAEMRTYAIGRHDYYDRLRTQLVAVSVALLPVAITIATLVSNATKDDCIPRLRLIYGGATTCIALGLSGLYVLVRFVIDFSPKYLYRGVADIRSWFYAYTPTPAFKGGFLMSKTKKEEAKKAFSSALAKYGAGWINMNADIDGPIMEDIEQTFILFGLQKFRRDEAARYAKSLAIGILIAFELSR